MVDRDVIREGYDELAERYAQQRAANGEQAILDEFYDSVPPSPRLLDAGCGGGEPVLRRLATEGTAVGIDLSRGQLQHARQKIPSAALAQAEMGKLPFPAETFDAITAFHSLIHVPLADHQQVVDEFARVLRPGGQLLVSEGTGEWAGSNPDWLESGVEMQWEIAGPARTREQIRRAGFRIVRESTAEDELAEEESRWLFFTAVLDG